MAWIKDQLIPLRLFLKILGIVLVYLCLPVPGPFLCWTFNDHPSALGLICTSSESGSWISAGWAGTVLLMEAHSSTSSAKSVSFLMSFTEWRGSSTLNYSYSYHNKNVIIYYFNKAFFFIKSLFLIILLKSILWFFNFLIRNLQINFSESTSLKFMRKSYQ